MLKLKDENGNDKEIIPLNKGISSIPLPKANDIPNKADKIAITIKVDGLPSEANDQDAINAAIRDFTASGVIDPMKVSNGANTFQELYQIIQDKDSELFRLRQLIKNYEQTR